MGSIILRVLYLLDQNILELFYFAAVLIYNNLKDFFELETDSKNNFRLVKIFYEKKHAYYIITIRKTWVNLI